MASCKSECGSTRELVEMVVDNLINKAVRDHVLQGALTDCDGTHLATGSKVVRCEALVALVNKAIKDGDITVIKDVEIENNSLVVTHGDGSVTETPLPGVVDLDIRDGKVVFTEKGKVKEFTLPGVTDLVFKDGELHFREKGEDKSIELPYVYDMQLNVKENRIDYKVNGEAKHIPLPEIGVKQVVEGDTVVTFIRPDGTSVELPKNTVTPAQFDSTIVLGINEAGRYGVSVYTNATGGAIHGNGSRNNPITLKYNPEQFSVVNGELTAVADKPVHVDNLDTGLTRCGFSTFLGMVNNVDAIKSYVIGMPADAENSRDNETPSVKSLADLVGQQKFDFSGYQLANDYQIDQFFVHGNVTWRRSNDSGVGPDCKPRNPNQWTAWKKETNLNIPLEVIENHTQEIASLLRRVVELENYDKCVDVTNKSLNAPSDGLNVLGFKCFHGIIDASANKFTVGVPVNMDRDIENRPLTQNAAMQVTDLTGQNGAPDNPRYYRFNGYQMASPGQIDQFLHEDWGVWRRSNSVGMAADGSVKDPNAWSQWRLLDNVDVWTAKIDQLRKDHDKCCTDHQNAITSIEERLKALKSENDRLNRENSDLSTQLQQCRSHASSLQSQLTKCWADQQTCQQRSSSLQAQLDQCRNQPRPNPPPTPQPPGGGGTGVNSSKIGEEGGNYYIWPNVDGYYLASLGVAGPWTLRISMSNGAGTVEKTGHFDKRNDPWYVPSGMHNGVEIGPLSSSGGPVTVRAWVNGHELTVPGNPMSPRGSVEGLALGGLKTIIQ